MSTDYRNCLERETLLDLVL